MKTPPSNPEFERFTAAVSAVLKVKPSELKERMTNQRESGKRLPKGSASLSPAVSEVVRSVAIKPV
jgi:hypothetical protein